MGTRADFYIESADQSIEWIGSIAFNGHTGNFVEECKTADKDEFRRRISDMLHSVDYATLPEQGWPWPWEYTGGTLITYVFREKYSKVYLFASESWDKTGRHGVFVDPLVEPWIDMPSMKCVENYTDGKRSGVYYISVSGGETRFVDHPDPEPPVPFPPAVFRRCPYCGCWIPPVNGTCECPERFGRRLTAKETIKWADRPLGVDARNNEFAFTFDRVFYYSAFFKNGELAVFKRRFRPSERDGLVRVYGETDVPVEG